MDKPTHKGSKTTSDIQEAIHQDIQTMTIPYIGTPNTLEQRVLLKKAAEAKLNEMIRGGESNE